MSNHMHMTNEQLRVLVRIEELLFKETPYSFENILKEAKRKPYYNIKEIPSVKNEYLLSSPEAHQGPDTQGGVYRGKRCSLTLSNLLRSLDLRETKLDES